MKKAIWAVAVAASLAVPAWAGEQPKAQGSAPSKRTVIQQRELDQLRRQLVDLQRQLAQRDAELKTVGGVGGSGDALDATPTGLSYDGVLTAISLSDRDVSVRMADNRLLQFRLDPSTRAYRDGKQVPLEAIREGTPVRVALPLINEKRHGRRQVESITVLPQK